MGSRGGENHRVGSARQKARNAISASAKVDNIVTLVDDNRVPVALLEPCRPQAVVLQRVDTDNGALIVVKRILPGWDLVLHALDANGIETHEWNGETRP